MTVPPPVTRPGLSSSSRFSVSQCPPKPARACYGLSWRMDLPAPHKTFCPSHPLASDSFESRYRRRRSTSHHMSQPYSASGYAPNSALSSSHRSRISSRPWPLDTARRSAARSKRPRSRARTGSPAHAPTDIARGGPRSIPLFDHLLNDRLRYAPRIQSQSVARYGGGAPGRQWLPWSYPALRPRGGRHEPTPMPKRSNHQQRRCTIRLATPQNLLITVAPLGTDGLVPAIERLQQKGQS